MLRPRRAASRAATSSTSTSTPTAIPAASKLLGAALVIDLVTLTADMQGGEVRGLLVIDEFAALAAEQVSRLFGRARSAGLSVLLGTQSLADLRGARPDDPSDTLTEQLLTNVEYAVVHREADPDSAERLARMAGTQPALVDHPETGRRRPRRAGFGPGRNPHPRARVHRPARRVQAPADRRSGRSSARPAKPPAEIVRVWPPEGWMAWRRSSPPRSLGSR